MSGENHRPASRRGLRSFTEAPDGREYLTVTDLSDALQVHEDTVRGMLARGELPGVRLGRRWYVRRAALDALFADAESGTEQEKFLP